jgi:undecaprenyl-diphosphatase
MTRRTSPELLAAGALLLVFAGLTLWARKHVLPLDARVLEWALRHKVDEGWRQDVQETFGYLGNPPLAGATVVVALLVVWRNVGTVAAAGFVAATAGVAVGALVQHQSYAGSITYGAPNFPSVHVVYVTVSWGYLAVLARRHGRPEVTAILVALIVVMAVSRLTQAAHYLSDVVAGLCLGGAWLLLVLAISSRRRPASG